MPRKRMLGARDDTDRKRGLTAMANSNADDLDSAAVPDTAGLPPNAKLQAVLDTDLLLPETPHKLRRVEYDQLVASGAFEDERIELLHGVLVEMSPIDAAHANPIDRLTVRREHAQVR